ncbi:ankyrin repeat domain-containing protein [Paenarthrobacter sp. RAF54_2]|uniref:ankyrin repeat domain-containing protein n=1 Tax=Paenarthrobacter sp. RAF54_2 TaxID=3233061 RepID=UPI003F9B58D6
MENDVATAEAHLADGASPDAQDKAGFTPLHFAAQEYAVAAAAALLRAGATVDLQNGWGNTALFTAVGNSNGRGELIKLLLSYGADPFCINGGGKTPVGFARLIGNYDVVVNDPLGATFILMPWKECCSTKSS